MCKAWTKALSCNVERSRSVVASTVGETDADNVNAIDGPTKAVLDVGERPLPCP